MSEAQEYGKRAQRLDSLHARFVNSMLEAFSWPEFEKCCGPIVDQYRSELESAHAQILDYWKENLWKEFDQIKTEANLIEKLNKLENAILQAKQNTNTKTILKTPEPDQTIRSLRVKLKLEALTKLREEEEKENTQLMEELSKKTDDYEHKKTNVVNTLTEYQEMVNVARSIPVEALEQVIDQLL
ncbi:hypothetical protein BDC45DRAFT_50512 [Circinella umbellata]|nr:hypothetical protein BDC45DRAFT_50512 [Circinella umbellata]